MSDQIHVSGKNVRTRDLVRGWREAILMECRLYGIEPPSLYTRLPVDFNV